MKRKNVDKIKKIALNGTPRQAKFAARYMSYCGHDDAPEQLVTVSHVCPARLTSRLSWRNSKSETMPH